LEEGCACDDGDPQLCGGLQQRDNSSPTEPLRGNTNGFRHCEIDRQLDYSEVVVITADIARNADELIQVEMPACIRRCAESVPRRASIAADVAAFHSLLEKRERVTEYRAETCGLHGVELLLRVVEEYTSIVRTPRFAFDFLI
jgi:hypothetical protein